MLDRLPARLLAEWMAFYDLEPFGGETAYLGHAITASTIANVNRGKDHPPYKLEDFVPKFERKKTTQTVEEQIQFAAMFTAALGGKDSRGDHD